MACGGGRLVVLHFIVQVTSGISCASDGRSEFRIDCSLMFLDERADELDVDVLGASRRWQIQVDHEDALHKPVDREPADNHVRCELDTVEQRKDHPISQPLCIIVLR